MECFFSRDYPTLVLRPDQRQWQTNRLLRLVLRGNLRDVANVVRVAQLPQGRNDVLAGDGLLGLALGDLVGLGREQGDELDATFDQEVARILGEGQAAVAAEDFGYNLPDGRWRGLAHAAGCARGDIPLGRERSSLPPPYSRSDMVRSRLAAGWTEGKRRRGKRDVGKRNRRLLLSARRAQ